MGTQKQIIVGVCTYRNGAAHGQFQQRILDALNGPGVEAVPVRGLAGVNEKCSLHVVRKKLCGPGVDAIVSLEANGGQLRVYHNGNETAAKFAAGKIVTALSNTGCGFSLPSDYAVDMKGRTFSALSEEIGEAFAGFGLPEIGVQRVKQGILHFKKSDDQLPLEKRIEMALNAFFDMSDPADRIRFSRAIEILSRIHAKYDYPLLFVKNGGGKMVPALHIELPEVALGALGSGIGGMVGRSVEKLLQSVRV